MEVPPVIGFQAGGHVRRGRLDEVVQGEECTPAVCPFAAGWGLGK